MDLRQFLRAMALIPVSSAILLLGLAGYLLVELHFSYAGLTYYPLWLAIKTGEVWRLISPVFLHFSFTHILFNALWIWELGRRIELYLGSWHYLLVFIVLALSSNTLQFYAIAGNNFGGLSGVVYGFVGFLLVARFINPPPILRIADGIYAVMLIFLALGYLGVLDVLVQGKIGNAAHLGGFLTGLLLGLIYFFRHILRYLIYRFWQKNENE